jgi:hypothetical protein
MSRIFAIMGSGETTPTMTATHRALKAAAGPGAAVLLDTPYGFQENADDITERTVGYFERSVNFTPSVASLRHTEAEPAVIAKGMSLIRSAAWVFTGPGSPTYALRQWHSLGLPQLLADRLERDGVLIMSSAAALTVGARTVPVYEIYKVGQEPEWFDGMDLLSPYGLDVALIPHFDNAEGGNHDTRFCYLGEPRLRKLEAQLGSEQWVLGVDEHTALLLDLESDTFAVQGRGVVTVRRAGKIQTFSAGHSGPLDDLRRAPGTSATVVSVPGDVPAVATPVAEQSTSVLAAVEPHVVAAEAALSDGNITVAVSALIEAEQALDEWKSDTSTTDERDRARQRFHGAIVALGESAEKGTTDPAAVVGPFVETVLSARRDARERKDWSQSDQLRDALLAAGVEVRDTPAGVTWSFKGA